MTQLEFDFSVSDIPYDPDAFLDEYELQMLFDQTRTQIRRQVDTKLGDMTCEQHGGAPRVRVTGLYSTEIEQFEIQYHIDGCCNLLVMRAIQALNH